VLRVITCRRLSKQTYSIIPKIREVDEYLIKHPEMQGRLSETHPEVCFWALSDNAMKFSKKRRAGREERL